MSSYVDSALRPYGGLSDIDPLTGLPRKKKAAEPAAAPLGGAYNPTNPGWGAAGTYAKNTGPINVGGSTPDYTSLIQQALAPFQAQLGAEGVQDLTGRNQQMIRALGQFGQQWDLGSANAAFGEDFVNQAGFQDILPQANELAGKTTAAGLSFKARADKAHKDTIRQIRNALAARGALQSGELGHQLQEEQTGFDTGQYDARLQVQDFLGAVQKGYLDAQRGRDTQLANAQREEAVRQAQLNPTIADRTATWNGTGYVYEDGTPVPRELWPKGAGTVPPVPTPPRMVMDGIDVLLDPKRGAYVDVPTATGKRNVAKNGTVSGYYRAP